MKSYFQGAFKILISIINYFFIEDSKKQKRTAYELLISASVCDTIEFVVKQSRIHHKSSKVLPEQLVIEQKEQIIRNAPLIADLKKQFKIWSENMKEYESIRTRLLDSV